MEAGKEGPEEGQKEGSRRQAGQTGGEELRRGKEEEG